MNAPVEESNDQQIIRMKQQHAVERISMQHAAQLELIFACCFKYRAPHLALLLPKFHIHVTPVPHQQQHQQSKQRMVQQDRY
jgi:hypothetical protein